jgi:dienelactone hydrolase
LSAEEIRRDFESKRLSYSPALPVKRVSLREMDARPVPGLWRTPITPQNWTQERERIRSAVLNLLGPFPTYTAPLEPRVVSETECGAYVRKKITIQVQPGDRMPAWLLVPKQVRGRVPAIICFYGTTGGAGKDTTVGLSGGKPGSPPVRNRAFALDMVEAGFVALAPDFLRDGERLPPSGRPYDTSDFYARFPEWSCVGKDIRDTQRAVDYLQTLPFADGNRIGMVGHSYGGHTTIFASALEPRIKAVFASGPVSDFRGHGMHWAVPKGAGNSQSLPNLRPYLLDPSLPLPVEFYEWTALIAPRPLWVNQAVGERRPHEEENYAAVRQVYQAIGAADRVYYAWCAGDHDFPPAARAAAVEWFKRWL